MRFVPSARFVLFLLGAFVLLIAGFLVIAVWPWLWPPPSYRFSLPSGTNLTEQIAIECSRKALAADGKESPGMCPTPYRDRGPGEDSTNLYFAVNTTDPNNGYVLWTTRQGTYGVELQKVGNEIVCQVYRSK